MGGAPLAVAIVAGLYIATVVIAFMIPIGESRSGSHLISTRGFPDGFVPPSASIDPPPTDATPAVEPRNERDPFCTCPKCGLLGTHHVEVVAVAVPPGPRPAPAIARPGTCRMAHPKLPGQPIDVPAAAVPGHERSGWAVTSRRAAPGTGGGAARWQAERICVFCDHLWYTDAGEECG